MISVGNVVSAAAAAIKAAFPDSEVFSEAVPQSLSPPCFSVVCAQPLIRRELGRRSFRRFDLSVSFFPGSDAPLAECGQAYELLVPALEIISVDGDLVRGYDQKVKYVDDVMLFSLSYGVFVVDDVDPENAPAPMKKLAFSVGDAGQKRDI